MSKNDEILYRKVTRCKKDVHSLLEQVSELRKQRDELKKALEQIQTILGITDTFVPLGPALDCAPIIRAALKKAKEVER